MVPSDQTATSVAQPQHINVGESLSGAIVTRLPGAILPRSRQMHITSHEEVLTAYADVQKFRTQFDVAMKST